MNILPITSVCQWHGALDTTSLLCNKKFVSFEVYSIQLIYDVKRSLSVSKCTKLTNFLLHKSEVVSSAPCHWQTSYHTMVKLYRVHFTTDRILITSLWSYNEYTSPRTKFLSHRVLDTTLLWCDRKYVHGKVYLKKTSLWCDKRFDPDDVYPIEIHYVVIRILSLMKCTRYNFTVMW
jgi:hypothetical protein